MRDDVDAIAGAHAGAAGDGEVVIGAEQPAEISQSETVNRGIDVQPDDEVCVVDRTERVVNGHAVRPIRGAAVEPVVRADIHGVGLRMRGLQGDGQGSAKGYFLEKKSVHRF